MSLLGELTYALISSASRDIGGIMPDVVVEEMHRDELIITDHPVETGAAITDHAFKRPSEVEMRCGFSNSSAGSEGYVQEVYQEFLALQASRQPFNVSTGKRSYRNMLIRGLAVTTDPKSEKALNVVVALREILIVSTQRTSSGSGSGGSGTAAPAASASDQASPQTTSEAIDNGDKQATGVGDTAFAGAFDPSGFSTTDPVTGGPTAELGEMTIEAVDGVPVPTPSPVEQPYNIYEFG
ncbi:phage baseplate protein [Methylobacterium sp. WL19]|uniref:phage baseplate protein n=1 Tax=Methylobacterium sp. WL19 TaxID=2603896 RepID=UPI0016504514|nr:hypothetical protein [Methylobacterium sp. WL19]